MQTALFRGVAVVLGLAATMPVNVQAAPLIRQQTRCGWIDNPTPANWWLTDGYGEWIIGVPV